MPHTYTFFNTHSFYYRFFVDDVHDLHKSQEDILAAAGVTLIGGHKKEKQFIEDGVHELYKLFLIGMLP